MVGGYPEHLGPYPDCPATCLDLWIIDYIDTPMDMSCVCNRETLLSVSGRECNAASEQDPGRAGEAMVKVRAEVEHPDACHRPCDPP